MGDLPEIVEHEVESEAEPVAVDLPVTINGRVFPREDVDLWTFRLEAGQDVTARLDAARLGSPLDPWLEILDSHGRRVAEGRPSPHSDVRATVHATTTGTFTIRVHDINAKGGQNYVYRLTLKTGADIEQVFPLGGKRGSIVTLAPLGTAVPAQLAGIALPETGKNRGPGDFDPDASGGWNRDRRARRPGRVCRDRTERELIRGVAI